MGTSTDVARQMWGSVLQRYTGEDQFGDFGRADEFVSAPLPSDLNLNVSRPFQLDLILSAPHEDTKRMEPGKCAIVQALSSDPYAFYVPTACHPYPCPYSLDVELYAGDALIAGAIAGAYASPALDPSDHSLPEGYIGCYYGLTPEVAHLAAGTVLKLRILHVSQESPFQYALGGSVRSQLRLSFYSPEEWAFRDPTVVPETTENEFVVASPPGGRAIAAVAASDLGWTTLVAGAALVFTSLGGRRWRAGLLILLLVLVAFSGCLTSKAGTKATVTDGSDGGRINSVFAKDEGISDAKNGSIVGFVHDDLHVPLPGVHVSVLGTPWFTDTDGRGRFILANLPPATYRLRFEVREYHSLEGHVQVKAGYVSKVDILLRLVNAKIQDLRPHSHDYWSGATQLLAMDEPVQVTCDGGYYYDYGTYQSYSARSGAHCVPGLAFTLPPKPPKADHAFNTIVPGTREVEVVLRWDTAATQVPRVGLLVQTNNPLDAMRCTDWCFGDGNWSQYYPRGPGEPFRIQTAWEHTDVGHEEFTRWKFRVFVAPVDYPGPARVLSDYVANAISDLPSVHVKITIHKGLLPLEAPHPDHWGNSNSVVVLNLKAAEYNWAPSCGVTGNGADSKMVVYPIVVQPAKVVPYETQVVEVKFSLSRATVPPTVWEVYYHPASLPPPESGYYGGIEGFRKAPGTPTSSGNEWTWKIPLQELDADGAYAKKTNWAFAAVPTDVNAYCADYFATTLANRLWQGWKVTAFREA